MATKPELPEERACEGAVPGDESDENMGPCLGKVGTTESE